MPKKYNLNESFRLHGGLLLGLSVVIAQLAIPPALANAMSEQQTLSPGPRSPGAMLPPHGNSAALPGEMLVYPKKSVDLSTLVSLGPPEALGGEVLTGNPQLYGRIDFQQGNMMGGLFMATTGLIRVTFPFTEHATIIEGKVTLTDETGKTHTFKAGDSYFIRQGSVILWNVKGPYVIKSFFNVTEPVAP
ncbi:cupin domain-containing protein [Hyalangium sp.]|uniref:cupin domain-containing protein n=1 Tax=Hyalangium sp. TaxID=2028555 RepID=UPI002D3FCDDD|nr:cupin domain-containing protein [Hyalangium sp.]HYH99739.1 cupin domain-containing protein [Hyalangium sp.]